MTKFQASKKQYKKAVARLVEILEKRKNKIVRDSAIKRFEFTFDLAWKTTKAYLEEKRGITCHSPKDCFKEAYRQGAVDYDGTWLKMADWRNFAVHTYNEKFADNLYKKLPRVLKLFLALAETLDKPS